MSGLGALEVWAIFAEAGHFGLTLGLFVMGNFTEHSKGFFFSLALLSGLPQSATSLYFSGFFFLALGHVTTLWQLAFCYIIDIHPKPSFHSHHRIPGATHSPIPIPTRHTGPTLVVVFCLPVVRFGDSH